MTEPRARAPRRAFLAAIVGIGILAAVSEAGVRFLLFHPSDLARRLGAGLRRPELFADPLSEEAYWKLRCVFEDRGRRVDVSHPDAPRRPSIREVDLRGRRPVLLHGDAFAACGTPPSRCFEGLLEESPLADRYALVDLAVPGQGLDEELLRLRESIDAWKDLDPIVAIGVPADDGLCRCALGFVEEPKPRFTIARDGLDLVLPDEPEATDYVLRHPIGIRSYLGRLLSSPWRGKDGPRAAAAPIVERLLEALHAELESRGLSHFLLVFDASEGSDWAAGLLETTATRLGLSFVRTRPYLRAAGGAPLESQASEPFAGPYTELGNRVAFEALRQGIEGRFGAPDLARAAEIGRSNAGDPGWKAERPWLDCRVWSAGAAPPALARCARTPYPPFDARERAEYLILRPAMEKPVMLILMLRGEHRRFRARAIAVSAPARSTKDSDLRLSIRLDGRLVSRSDVPAWPEGLDVDVELGGVRELELSAEHGAGPSDGAWIHLAGARLE